MAINALQVAWISRLAGKKIIRPGDSILEFGPQDLLCARAVVEQYGLRHKDAQTVRKVLDEAYDGESPKPVVPSAFYSLFGTDRYRSLDLMDTRSDWLRDCNEPFKLPERFDVVTNFGTAEHVFNIGAMFQSVHDALKPGGVALHVLPAFGDVNHGFYNIHPTTYLDLAAANNYSIDEICYVDRWDIRNRTLEENIAADFDFDSIPIQMEDLVDRFRLQRKVVELYIANYNDPKTQQYGPAFPGYVYDYCIVALRKNDDGPFRYPVQGYYGGGVAPSSGSLPPVVARMLGHQPPAAVAKAVVRRFVLPLIPDFVRRPLIRSVLKTLLRDLALDVSGHAHVLSISDSWVPLIFSRQTYPSPLVDEASMDRMMTVVESRIERLYNNSNLGVTINDLDDPFLKRIKTLLNENGAFVIFMDKRYQNRVEGSAARTKAIDDINALVSKT
jgi:SAM-dependent methyltransferase